MKNNAIEELADEFGLVANSRTREEMRQLIAKKINTMITNDLHALIALLYRVDINEQKLKGLLKDNPGTDAALIITDLLIERQEQKIRSRRDTRRDTDVPEEDKW